MMAGGKLFDDDLVHRLIELIKVGNYLNTACAAVGITETSYHTWLRDGLSVEEIVNGRENEDELKERMQNGELVLGFSARDVRSWLFRNEVMQATAMGEAYAVATIRSQMPNQWQAAMTFLERRFPQRWRRRDQIDIGDASETVNTGIDESLLLSDPQAVKLIHEALAQASRKAIPDAIVVDDEKSPPS